MKIIAYNEEQNYGIEDNNKLVYSLVVDNQFYYRKHKHRGTLQTSILPSQWIVASEFESDLQDYINDNNLLDINSVLENWHSEHQDKQFQIILTEKQAVQLILVKPEFGFLNETTITENSYVYIYVNYIEDEDMILLESQNIIINQNEN